MKSKYNYIDKILFNNLYKKDQYNIVSIYTRSFTRQNRSKLIDLPTIYQSISMDWIL